MSQRGCGGQSFIAVNLWQLLQSHQAHAGKLSFLLDINKFCNNKTQARNLARPWKSEDLPREAKSLYEENLENQSKLNHERLNFLFSKQEVYSSKTLTTTSKLTHGA